MKHNMSEEGWQFKPFTPPYEGKLLTNVRQFTVQNLDQLVCISSLSP